MHAECKASASDADVLEQPEVHDLMLAALIVELRRRLVLVRLDTTHVVRLLDPDKSVD